MMPVRLAWLVWPAATVIMVAGCAATPSAPRRLGTEVDPCAERLHEICGHLLLYWSARGRLPADMSELARAGAGSLPPLSCPASDAPYVYRPDGVSVPGRPGRVVLFDAAPVHGGMRWAIVTDAPAAGKPLTARVVLLPDDPAMSATR